MRTAIAALFAIALLGGAAADGADVGSKCLSKREARAMWPTKHIYWFNDGGRRCWGDRRGGRAKLLKVNPKPQQQLRDLPPRPVPEAEPLPYVAPELVPVLPSTSIQFPPQPMFDEEWMRQQDRAREKVEALAQSEITIYSTFAGAPPDVWPELKPQRRINVGLVAMMLTAAFAFAAGMLASWYEGIEP
jgi:hypothetical protein